MSSRKFTQRIDRINYTACFRLVRKYYLWKEGTEKRLLDSTFIQALFARFFCLIILVFRFNKYPHKIHYNGKLKNLVAQLLGFHNFKRAEVPLKLPFYRPLEFPRNEAPLVTIIIAVYNQWEFTYSCLKSIIENTSDISYRVIVVDDGSTDETASCLQQYENITLIQNDQNMGFLRSCNKAAATVTSEYICFLNNDTLVGPRWLHHMLDVFNTHDNTGIVGAKLVFPYGLLQEAGGLVNAAGEPANFGRSMDARDYKYNYLRETDYCSGACLLIQAPDFFSLGGFNEKYAPAYYEDTDLCFAMRFKLGKKVFYQPLAEVIHFEGISSGKRAENGNVNSHQAQNATIFVAAWKPFLDRFSNSRAFDAQEDKFSEGRKKILIIEGYLPFYDKDSGSRRIYELIRIFLQLHVDVYYMAEYGGGEDPYYSELVTRGVRMIYEPESSRSKETLLHEILPVIDYAWIARPHLNEAYAPLIRTHKKITWIYDTVDLHYLRLERSLAYGPSKDVTPKAIDALKKKELGFAQEADITIVVTPQEKDMLTEAGARNVKVIPNIHSVKELEGLPAFEAREGICFIGSYDHLPNVDAVLWLVREIMPVVWKQQPGMRLILLGSNPPDEVLALKSDRIEVPGYLHDVSPYFYNSRLFVAPLRYGAGMKGKIGQAMEYGLPIVSTDIGIEGMGLVVDEDVVLANTGESFAKAILELYDNEERWNKIAQNSRNTIRRYTPENVRKSVEGIFI
ncbi:glycosyltransferase [Niabella sp.]|uniref:glycosyltransferase n=1 Tax=Niabella sp. TaxID=1962976 RepID=UPI0026256665|nr:glycosyltransferase [Niabella sp.]